MRRLERIRPPPSLLHGPTWTPAPIHVPTRTHTSTATGTRASHGAPTHPRRPTRPRRPHYRPPAPRQSHPGRGGRGPRLSSAAAVCLAGGRRKPWWRWPWSWPPVAAAGHDQGEGGVAGEGGGAPVGMQPFESARPRGFRLNRKVYVNDVRHLDDMPMYQATNPGGVAYIYRC